MSLKKNILANYTSQIYAVLIGILILPLYIKYMGNEAYGLVGFFAMLQVWFNLFDLGLIPTFSRQTACFRGGAMDISNYRSLVRALEGVFFAIALIGGAVIFLSAGYIARSWLQVAQLPVPQVQKAIQLMSLIIALRWLCGLYRGQISGFEKLVWLGWYNASIATLRFIGAWMVLMFIGVTPVIFFSYQLIVAVLELVGVILYAYRLLPAIPDGKHLAWSWKPLKPMFNFSLTLALASLAWVAVTQTDKLVLSKFLPLGQYGYFTLAVLAASGVMMIGEAVSGAIMPRMARLEAENNQIELIRVYRWSTQLVAVMAGAIAVTLSFNAESLLWVWTGDRVLAHQAAPILVLYVIGNCVLAVSAFPYYLQYAKGDLRFHLAGSIMFVILLIPAVIWAAGYYGGVGAGYTWLIVNLLFFVGWTPWVHRKFAPALNQKWYFQDVTAILTVTGLAGYGLHFIFTPSTYNRGWAFLAIAGFGFLVILSSISGSSVARSKLKLLFAREVK